MKSRRATRSILHVGGVGTNSYLNCKLLVERNYVSHVAANDIYHCVCTPEWQELDPKSFRREELGNDFFPNFFRIAASADVRQRWFAQGPQFLVITYLYYLIRGERGKADLLWQTLQYQRFKAVLKRTTVPEVIRLEEEDFQVALAELHVAPVFREVLTRSFENERLLDRFVRLLAKLNDVADLSSLHPPFTTEMIDAVVKYDYRLAEDVAVARLSGETVGIFLEHMPLPDPAVAASRPPPGHMDRIKTKLLGARTPPSAADPAQPRWRKAGVRAEDAAVYRSVTDFWGALFDNYDLRMCYGASAILGLLSGARDYMAYEHGTIRSLPFHDDSQGRLVRAAYEQADAVFITNTDYISARPRLEFLLEKRVYVPHVFDERPLFAFARDHRPAQRAPGPARFFMPSRQDWVLNDPARSKANHLVIDAAALLVAEKRTNFHVTFVAWGDDIAASKDRIAEKGLDDHFSWINLVMRHDLWMHYVLSDAVLDQFLISGISGVTYEALALGCRIITKDDGICNREFFGEPPPFLAAGDAREIAARMRAVILDPDDRAGTGPSGERWIAKYHSSDRFVALEEAQFDRLIAARRQRSNRTRFMTFPFRPTVA